jgi:hypothetical protein
MGKGSPKAPAAPDPVATSQAQTASNKETAQYNAALNRIDEYTPYGSRKYTQIAGDPQYNMDAYNSALSAWQGNQVQGNPSVATDYDSKGRPIAWSGGSGSSSGGSNGNMPQLKDYLIPSSELPKYRSDIEFTPEGQALFDLQQQQDLSVGNIANSYLGKIGDVMGEDYSYDGLAPAPQADDAARQRIEQALMERLNPYIERDRESQESRLANQGITHGSEAYDRAQTDFGKNVNDARLAAIAQAGQEQSRLFDLGSRQRNQAIQEYDAQRSRPLNEFNALRSATQLQTPTFGSTQPVSTQGTDTSSNIWKNFGAQQDAYNQQIASNNNTTTGLFSLAAAAPAFYTAFSDRRLKTAIERIGETKGGVPVYRYKYKGADKINIGVMSDEVGHIPGAVLRMPNGFDMVDYRRIT